MAVQTSEKPSTVDEYLAGFDGLAAQRLAELRRICRESAPEAEETMKWNQPAYVHECGVILFMFSGHARHANIVFTPTTREHFHVELAGYRTGKGSVQLIYEHELPEAFLRRMIEHRIQEHEDHGISWM
ncbi:DUF1801 domain-containing protein [Nesterenkonia halobia]|uniref:YdhG-like domain-containing protein n=1 Tax=Nesterenkonia halobia TaxID=37922 RepID=A0ABP6RL58_9MICC